MIERPHLKDKLWAKFVDPTSKADLANATEVLQEDLKIDSFRWKTPQIGSVQNALM